MAIHPGDVLAGYRVTRLLGRGGMGEVWAAVPDDPQYDGQPDRFRPTVALKVLLASAALKPDLVRRFEREAMIASAIKSPYVCQFLEVRQADDGSHLLVFEHLSGESLADRLKREQYLPFTEVGPIIEDVLLGLVDAHAAGVIHRDLKPGNIFLVDPNAGRPRVPAGAEEARDRRERAKILDFGVSKLLRREGTREPTLTAFDATLGSFAYMAPEQVRGAARADERADIYAIGAVAFRALAGRLPFEGANAAALVAMKLERPAPSLAQITGEHWPLGVERFLERALERTRDNRFQTAAEALEAWQSLSPRTEAAYASQVPPPMQTYALVSAEPDAPSHHGVSTWPGIAPEPAHRAVPGDAAAPPPGRAPLPSYQIIEDSPTEVDEPPTMTVEGHPLVGVPQRPSGRQ